MCPAQEVDRLCGGSPPTKGPTPSRDDTDDRRRIEDGRLHQSKRELEAVEVSSWHVGLRVNARALSADPPSRGRSLDVLEAGEPAHVRSRVATYLRYCRTGAPNP